MAISIPFPRTHRTTKPDAFLTIGRLAKRLHVRARQCGIAHDVHIHRPNGLWLMVDITVDEITTRYSLRAVSRGELRFTDGGNVTAYKGKVHVGKAEDEVFHTIEAAFEATAEYIAECEAVTMA